MKAYAKGNAWGLGPEVLRTYDNERNAGVTCRLAYMFAIGAWEVEVAPPPYCRDHLRFLHGIGKPKK